LESEHKHLIEELKQLTANIRPAEERREGSPFGKREEEATETLELEKRLALETRLRDLLTEMEHALRKFDSGTYGLCDNCGQQIDPARLEALPEVNLCLSCKAQEEKKAKMMPIFQSERVARYPRYDEKVTHVLNFNAPDELGVEEDEEVS